MASKRKTVKQYEAEEAQKIRRLTAARKRKAAERHEATAARFRAEAEALEAAAS